MGRGPQNMIQQIQDLNTQLQVHRQLEERNQTPRQMKKQLEGQTKKAEEDKLKVVTELVGKIQVVYLKHRYVNV